MPEQYDVAIIGAGIVGLATAHSLLRKDPSLRIAVVEKESAVGRHQTGHNSGVIHSGVYYRPGSAKARLCLRGRGLMIDFCAAHGIPIRRTGKLVVATRAQELPALEAIRERAAQNGIGDVRPLAAAEIRDLEPEIRGVAALEVPSTAIVDYKEVVRAMAKDLTDGGAGILLASPLRSVERTGDFLELRTPRGDVRTRFMVNCAGLHSDHVARLAGLSPKVQIVPFRGEFYRIRPERRLSLGRLIYPVPDPALPFLGVHLTLTMSGEITAGPNAVLATAREGYSRATLSPADSMEMATYPGFWRMARKFLGTGLYEQYRSLSRTQYADDLRRFAPGLSADDLLPGDRGVRAQAVDREGRLVDDFVFESGPRSLHVLNAPSPAATSSLAIAEEILQQFSTNF